MQTVILTAYGAELLGANVNDRAVELQDVLALLGADTSADGETSAIVDGDNVIYAGRVVGVIVRE